METIKVNVGDNLSIFKDYWSPVVGQLNNQMVKLAKFTGDFVMHHHENEDELFYVIAGELIIELKGKTLRLRDGEFVVVPKGVEHKPYAPEAYGEISKRVVKNVGQLTFVYARDPEGNLIELQSWK